MIKIVYKDLRSQRVINNILKQCLYFTLSPSWTLHVFSAVAGFTVAKVLPLTEFTNSLLIKICVQNIERYFETERLQNTS